MKNATIEGTCTAGYTDGPSTVIEDSVMSLDWDVLMYILWSAVAALVFAFVLCVVSACIEVIKSD